MLSRLERLEVTGTARALVQRFVNRQITVQELDTAIDLYLDANAGIKD